jgi:hypothetical protein
MGYDWQGLRLPLMAQSVSLRGARPCPELGVKPTCRLNARTSQFDPERTLLLVHSMAGLKSLELSMTLTRPLQRGCERNARIKRTDLLRRGYKK